MEKPVAFKELKSDFDTLMIKRFWDKMLGLEYSSFIQMFKNSLFYFIVKDFSCSISL